MSASVIASAREWEFGGGYGAISGSSLGAGFGYRGDNFALAVAAENLNRPRPGSNEITASSVVTPREFNLFSQWRSSASFSTFARFHAEENRPAQWGAGQALALSRGASFQWGFATTPLTFCSGFDFAFRRFALTYGAEYNPNLGYTHGAAMVFRFAGAPR